LGIQLYGLVRIAELLDDEELLDLGRRTLAWFIPERIALREAPDVIGGVAGGIFGLLALWSASGHDEALSRAVFCGDHLLKQLTKTDPARPLTGFAHGTAGIGYALLRLSHATGEDRFREAAQECIACETSTYSAETRNWPNVPQLHKSQGESSLVGWCHGAAGIGLARLGGLGVLDSSFIRQDIGRALHCCLSVQPGGVDHLCCGGFGLLEFFLESGRRLGRDDLVREAEWRAAWIVRRAHRKGWYTLNTQIPGVISSPSFFHGTAGIGYALLRLLEPERLPCVLLWE
jgi:lantibiotic modifying enzyme